MYILPYLEIMDAAFKKIIGLAGIKAARLVRRVPTSITDLKPSIPSNNILDNISVAVITEGSKNAKNEVRIQNLSNFINLAGGGAFTTPGKDINKEINAIVFDTRGMKSADDLKQIHPYMQPAVSKLGRNGRVVVISGRSSNENADCVTSSAIAAAVHGFSKSLAKELAGKGITANTIRIDENVSEKTSLPGVLQFLLSKRSAFITGQILSLSDNNLANFDMEPKSSFSVQKKRVLVTGSARGIGEFTARLFHAEGAEVVLLDHPSMEGTLKDISQKLMCNYIPLDVSNPDSTSLLKSSMLQLFGNLKLDAVVHNAGITRDKTFRNMSSANFDSVIDVNLSSVIRLDNFLFAESLTPGGKAVYLSSISGIAGTFGQTNYSCSKAGIIGYVAALGSKVSTHGIGVNAIAPGFIETEMTKQIPFLTRNVGRHMNALLQGGYPADVAEAALFLSSGASNGVNGNTLRVCGGHMIGS